MQRNVSNSAHSTLQSSLTIGCGESSGRKSVASACTTAMALLALVTGTHAQTKRCDLESRDTTTSTGVPFKKCLDLASLDGKTIVVPSNVTRIDNDGLSL